MQVLSYQEIQEAITDEKMLSDSIPDSIKGASYDIRTGSVATLIEPKRNGFNGYQYTELSHQRTVRIRPGFSCTLRSRELVRMPPDMFGLLFNRMEWVHKRLNFDGGLVDPGYHGYLFMTVTNLGDTDVEIEFEKPLIAIVFIRLSKEPTRQYQHKETILNLPECKLPPPPSGQRYDAIQLSTRIDMIEKQLGEMQEACRMRGSSIQANSRFIDSVLLGALAGLFAGGIIAVVAAVKSPYSTIIGAIAVGLAIVGWFRVRPRRPE